ncbi:hypothetical protein NDU88_010418 [Pleurodeles waltl]|uniref:Uncharacterized protein n=1 Tax=Pleurodeles waltl TaxID=8319 RepID=A0AAV7S0R5_PLEWA|nr:hypothetical protein NDU88_010418 [Pleurodeles waltl]
MSKLPESVWQQVAVDFFVPLLSGIVPLQSGIVMMDEYSPFTVVQQVSSTRAATTLPVLDEVFTAWRILEVVKTEQSKLARQDVQAALNEVLTAYRPTPHSTTNKCPATLMLGRTVRTTILTWEKSVCYVQQATNHNELVELDRAKKAKMKK